MNLFILLMILTEKVPVGIWAMLLTERAAIWVEVRAAISDPVRPPAYMKEQR